MRHRAVWAAALLLAACTAFGQDHAAKSSKNSAKQANVQTVPMKLEDQLEANVRAAWTAFKEKNKKAYSDYLWDDFMAVEEDGDGERNKLKILREVEKSVVHDFSLQLFRVDPIGSDAALVTYENIIQFPPKASLRFEKIFVSEIWLRRNGQWKVWRYQATRVR
jgi:hypothetical protein